MAIIKKENGRVIVTFGAGTTIITTVRLEDEKQDSILCFSDGPFNPVGTDLKHLVNIRADELPEPTIEFQFKDLNALLNLRSRIDRMIATYRIPPTDGDFVITEGFAKIVDFVAKGASVTPVIDAPWLYQTIYAGPQQIDTLVSYLNGQFQSLGLTFYADYEKKRILLDGVAFKQFQDESNN